MDTTPLRHSPNVVLMLGQRLRCWPNIEQALEKCRATKVLLLSKHKTFVQHLYNVGQTSSTLAQVWVSPFQNPRSNTVSLFAR